MLTGSRSLMGAMKLRKRLSLISVPSISSMLRTRATTRSSSSVLGAPSGLSALRKLGRMWALCATPMSIFIIRVLPALGELSWSLTQ